MQKKTSLNILIVAVVVGGIGFYAWMKYGESKTPLAQNDFQNFRNLSPEERQARIQESGMGGAGGMGRGGRIGGQQGGGFVNGEIITKDDKSVTVKLRNGGSQIIFYSDTTEVGKFINGAPADLIVGETITVNGKKNSDGSITAQSIQIRPARESASSTPVS